MNAKIQSLINFFESNEGAARFSEMLKAGFHPDSLAYLINAGKAEKIGRGLYMLKDSIVSSHSDLVRASLQSSRGVVCLLSALAFYEATNEIPRYVDMAIPAKTHANRIEYPPVKFYRFDLRAWEAGITEQEIDGHKIRVYSLAKTIADCFKFRNRIGADVARNALKVAISEKNIKPKEIMAYAKICRVDKIIKPVVETMI